MNASSNTTGYAVKTGRNVAVRIPSGAAANTITQIASGIATSSLLYDLLFRSLDSTNRNFDIIIGNSSATPENNRVQIMVAANSGNNGTSALASLQTLASQLFRSDLAGNRYIHLEDAAISVWVVNKAALTADVYVTALIGDC